MTAKVLALSGRSELKIRVASLRYHRNGVRGNGFVVVGFSYNNARNKRQNAIATVFSGSDEDQTKFTGYCAVLTLDDVGRPELDPMRGDDFEHDLRHFIESPEGQVMMFPHISTSHRPM
jgi:hypothetical protein